VTDREKDLLAGCLRREKAAWDAFVVQYSALVYHTIKKTFSLYHTEPRTEQIEDLYQGFFLCILRDDFKKLRQFRGDRGCSLASWLRMVATRLTVDFLRKREATDAASTKGTPSSQPDPPDGLIDREKEGLLLRGIQSLPSPDRLFLDLCFRQALLPQDIAGILKISVPAVYTQKSRILSKLRELLSKTGAM
jgi:RNA polymerase sigma factor (sigma-70 family)